ncbi:hypothetical protein STEG23_021078, partial [Scotinomys teguina]
SHPKAIMVSSGRAAHGTMISSGLGLLQKAMSGSVALAQPGSMWISVVPDTSSKANADAKVLRYHHASGQQ